MAEKVLLTREAGKGKKLILKVMVSARNIYDGTANVVGLWREDTHQIVGHTESAEGNNVEFKAEFHLDHYLGEDLPIKFCMYSTANTPVDESHFVGSHVTTLQSLFKQKKQEQELKDNDGANIATVLDLKTTVLPDPNQKKKEKPKKEAQPQLSKEEAKKLKEREKLIKAAVKEGGKKGQDLCGMSTFGVHFFCTSVDSPGDDWELMDKCMEGMNKEVDENADDRKGGAGDLAKLLFSAGDTKLLLLCHVPASVEGATAEEFLKAVADSVDAKIIESTDEMCKAEALADPDNNRFPLKMKDTAIGAGFAFLRSKSLVLDDDDSGDEINFADDCGVDLNAGAEGDY